MRVLLCDDSAVMRRVIREILESEEGVEVVAVARNGAECVELAKSVRPDLITLDIEMPVMDGLTALRKIMGAAPTDVLMISSLTAEGSRESLRALRAGAADVVAKDHANHTTNAAALKAQILERVRALRDSPPLPPRPRAQTAPNPRTPAIRSHQPGPDALDRVPTLEHPVTLTVIGSSTGGPPVVEHVLSKLPKQSANAIVVAQHMPRMFTKSMAEHLDSVCNLPVVHLDPGVPVKAGRVHIAPGGLNTHIRHATADGFTVRIDTQPAGTVYFPSATALFESAAAIAGRNALGIVLTGMGNDGGAGAAAIIDAGGAAFAQDAASCVVYGMPKSAAEHGAPPLHPDQIASLLGDASRSSVKAA